LSQRWKRCATQRLALAKHLRGLLVLDCRLSGGTDADASRIEDHGSDFGFGALGGDFFAIPEEIYSGGVAGFDCDFAGGVDRSVGGGDQGFGGDFLAVGVDGDPGIFRGADDQGQGC
jgi:hypothetical protein